MNFEWTSDTKIDLNTWAHPVVEKKSEPIAVPARRQKEVHHADRLFLWFLRGMGISVVILLALIAAYLFLSALPSIRQFGFTFLTTSVWDPVKDVYGALPVIFGTVVSSLLGIALATPVSLGIALFLNELAPRRLASIVGFLVEMLAAIPSVVYGLWGIFVLAPWLQSTVEPLIGNNLGFIPLFEGPYYGVGMFAAGIILAIMVTPTISSICREVFRAIPRSQREATLALGGTRWEMMNMSVLKSSRAGIVSAVILGLGRALGETMAVTMVIGNRSEIVASLFAPSQTMSSVIANQYAEATSDVLRSSLAEIGLALFAVTLVINGFARFFIWRVTKPKGSR